MKKAIAEKRELRKAMLPDISFSEELKMNEDDETAAPKSKKTLEVLN